jgi:hypothetical protein
MTFQDFIQEALTKSAEVRLVPHAGKDGTTRFYAHLADVDGYSVDYHVIGDQLVRLPFAASSDEPVPSSDQAVSSSA